LKSLFRAKGFGLKFHVAACKKAFLPLNAWATWPDELFQQNRPFTAFRDLPFRPKKFSQVGARSGSVF
jgi:hypothetical protein